MPKQSICCVQDNLLEELYPVARNLLKEPLAFFFALLLLSSILSFINSAFYNRGIAFAHEAGINGPFEQVAVIIRIVLLALSLGYCFTGCHLWTK